MFSHLAARAAQIHFQIWITMHLQLFFLIVSLSNLVFITSPALSSGGPSSGGRCRLVGRSWSWSWCWARSSAAPPPCTWAAPCVWAPPSSSPPPPPPWPFWPPGEATTWAPSPSRPPEPWRACAGSWARACSESGPSWRGRRRTASPGARLNSCVRVSYRPCSSWRGWEAVCRPPACACGSWQRHSRWWRPWRWEERSPRWWWEGAPAGNPPPGSGRSPSGGSWWWWWCWWGWGAQRELLWRRWPQQVLGWRRRRGKGAPAPRHRCRPWICCRTWEQRETHSTTARAEPRRPPEGQSWTSSSSVPATTRIGLLK